jgi:hypothetical protein
VLTPDEKRLLIDLCRCVDLIGWHVRQLQADSPDCVEEITGALDNLKVIQRVLQGSKETPSRGWGK